MSVGSYHRPSVPLSDRYPDPIWGALGQHMSKAPQASKVPVVPVTAQVLRRARRHDEFGIRARPGTSGSGSE